MEREGRLWEERGLRAAVLAGDEAAWRALYDRHFDPLYRYVFWRSGKHPQRAEEAVQECWSVAVRRIRRFDPDRAAFGTWLRGIADNVLRNHRRRWERRDRTEVSSPADAPAPALGGLAVAEQVALAMTALPPRYQDALRAKYEHGYSVADMAARWGDTPKAIESLLARARAAFREEYRRLEQE